MIVVEHRDRLMRFGVKYVESALAAQGRRVVVITPGEVKDDLVQDMIEVLTSFCTRLYGRRSAKSKARKAMEALALGSSVGAARGHGETQHANRLQHCSGDVIDDVIPY